MLIDNRASHSISVENSEQSSPKITVKTEHRTPNLVKRTIDDPNTVGNIGLNTEENNDITNEESKVVRD